MSDLRSKGRIMRDRTIRADVSDNCDSFRYPSPFISARCCTGRKGGGGTTVGGIAGAGSLSQHLGVRNSAHEKRREAHHLSP